MLHGEHIVIWHLIRGDHATTTKFIKHRLTQHDKLVLFRGRHIGPWVKNLIKKENPIAETLAATSEPFTQKPVSSSGRNAQSPRGMQTKAQVTALGSKHDHSLGAKSTTTVLDSGYLKSAKVHKKRIQPHCKGCVCKSKNGTPMTQINTPMGQRTRVVLAMSAVFFFVG